MSDLISHDHEESSVQQRPSRHEQSAEAGEIHASPAQSAVNASRLATSGATRGRGNGTARTSAILSMQQMHGNRAVQRQFAPNPYTSVPDYVPWSTNPYEIAPNPYSVPQNPYGGSFDPYEIKPNPYSDPRNFPGEPYDPDNYLSPVLDDEGAMLA